MASAAYRSGEKLHSEYFGEDSDYTNKGGVICSEIFLPPHVPREYADRETLWNAVEKVEKGKKAQLAYSFDISFQNEFTQEENIALARQFLTEHFVSRGMVVDFAVHEPEKEEGGINNPHFHFMCPIRPIEQNGKWGLKQKREYVLDETGNRIPDGKGDYVFNAVPTTDWGSADTLEFWREQWAVMCNAKFEEKGLDVRIDHRSYERQGVELLPTRQKARQSEPWKRKASRPKRASSIAGSEEPMPLFVICEKVCRPCWRLSKKSRQNWISRNPSRSSFRCKDILICATPKPIPRRPGSTI